MATGEMGDEHTCLTIVLVRCHSTIIRRFDENDTALLRQQDPLSLLDGAYRLSLAHPLRTSATRDENSEALPEPGRYPSHEVPNAEMLLQVDMGELVDEYPWNPLARALEARGEKDTTSNRHRARSVVCGEALE